ncbi:MAG: hypothetical protein M0Q14_10695 [Tissierellaceae bacterium]|nr:hypothetical protein [Tissierellaceae bacterium]
MLFNIKIEEQTLNNLKAFLTRINLTGKEVPAFNEILASVYNAIPVEGGKEVKNNG